MRDIKNSNGRLTLGRSECLKGKKTIQNLFESGNVLRAGYIKLAWGYYPSEDLGTIKVGFAVPKSKFNKSTDRNLLKRRMRESFRLGKNLIPPPQDKSKMLGLIFVYTGSQIECYKDVYSKIMLILARLSKVCGTYQKNNQ